MYWLVSQVTDKSHRPGRNVNAACSLFQISMAAKVHRLGAITFLTTSLLYNLYTKSCANGQRLIELLGYLTTQH